MGVGWDKAWKWPGRRNAEFVLLPEAGTGCTQLSKLPTPVQMDSDSVGLGASMADLGGGVFLRSRKQGLSLENGLHMGKELPLDFSWGWQDAVAGNSTIV